MHFKRVEMNGKTSAEYNNPSKEKQFSETNSQNKLIE